MGKVRITTDEIEIIIDSLRDQRRDASTVKELTKLLILQTEWERRWIDVAELEESESVLDWLENV